MALLIFGIILWWAAHLFKRLAPAQRAHLGTKGKGLVALALLASVVLMVIGYRGTEYIHVWAPPSFLVHVNNSLMVLALFFTSPGPRKGRLFRKMRHPMLFGFSLWAVAHLLVNGDLASVILFGGLLVWAGVEVLAINRAEPEWKPGPKGTTAKGLMFLAISILLVGVIGYIHGLIGPSPFPG
ncbi:NnrU family protein [Tritonibacter scottomollicae]|uniref:NnrU family protein n=1 Tax=Tritonibacter scottomollicae TaxID=483013 RepID=UPI003BAB153C